MSYRAGDYFGFKFVGQWHLRDLMPFASSTVNQSQPDSPRPEASPTSQRSILRPLPQSSEKHTSVGISTTRTTGAPGNAATEEKPSTLPGVDIERFERLVVRMENAIGDANLWLKLVKMEPSSCKMMRSEILRERCPQCSTCLNEQFQQGHEVASFSDVVPTMPSLTTDMEFESKGDVNMLIGEAMQTCPAPIVAAESRLERRRSRTCDTILTEHSSDEEAYLHCRSQPCLSVNSVPARAFVVNFQRMILMKKVFQMLHEFIHSTVIASLTLVRVGNIYQLCASCAFMLSNYIIYSAHSWHHDTMEIDDYMNLSELIRDDEDALHKGMVDNPNRLIKALSFSRRGLRRWSTRSVNVFMFLGSQSLWALCLLHYNKVVDINMSDDDKELTLTLLLVGSILISFHLVYDWLFFRETQCIMPPSPGNPHEPWDPRLHGLPPGLRWFGLPCMWFTSEEAVDRLRKWIAKAKGIKGTIDSMYPQEMAMFALSKDKGRLLCAGLRRAKLYDSRDGKYMVCEDGSYRPVKDDEDPDKAEKLAIDLVYYDSLQHVHGQKGLGEYLLPKEEYVRTEMEILSSKSLTSSEDI